MLIFSILIIEMNVAKINVNIDINFEATNIIEC